MSAAKPYDEQEIEALLKKATPGEWHVPVANVHRVIAAMPSGHRLIVEHPADEAHFGIEKVSYRQTNDTGEQCAVDRLLICALRNAAPALLATIATLRAQADAREKDALERAAKCCESLALLWQETNAVEPMDVHALESKAHAGRKCAAAIRALSPTSSKAKCPTCGGVDREVPGCVHDKALPGHNEDLGCDSCRNPFHTGGTP